MSRLPIRLRLTLAFALAMALVLAATGTFLYLRLGASLDEAIDESLEARTAELTPQVAEGDARLRETFDAPSSDADERFVQVLDLAGRVRAATPGLPQRPLLPDSQAPSRVIARQSLRFELGNVPGVAGRARLFATRVDASEAPRVLLVGASLEDRDEALRGFLTELLLVGPAALVLASLLGYGLAAAALRPVEAMRAEADAISGSEPGRRLPLPTSHDEVYRLGTTLNEMLERLEAALEGERGFVADAGHELRTPLASLKAELELALRRPRTGAELEDAIRSAAEETDRLARLAEDLLLLARSDHGRLRVRRERVSVESLLQDVAKRFERRLHGADRRIDVHAPAGLELEADRGRLEQALGNLVENALDHGSGRVDLRAVERDGAIELHAEDEGGGFAPGFLPRAFDRFSRADDARSGNGTGLGLSITAAIAKAHGGSAHAANRESRGADVWLSIPSQGRGMRRPRGPGPLG